MKINKESILDILLFLVGVVLYIIVKNSTRFIGVGLISLATTYLIIDNIEVTARIKTIIAGRNKGH
jgi:hypothetical protein